MGLIRSSHSSLNLASQMQQYVTRIQKEFHSDISYFSLVRTYQNRKRICLTSLPNFHQTYVNEKLYLNDNLDTPIENYTSGVFNWQSDQYSDTHLICRDHFNTEQGITIIIKGEYFCDFFTFGCESYHHDPSYYQNLFIFYQIIQDFYLKGRALITKSDDLVLFRNQDLNKNTDIKVITDVTRGFKYNRGKYLSKIYLSDISDTAYITSREKEILNYMVYGKTHVEISIILDKSLSTIRNQMNSLKKRLGCNTQEQMIFKISKSIFSDMVFSGLS